MPPVHSDTELMSDRIFQFQLNNCPICRIPFKALLRFRTLVTKTEKHGISSTGLSAIGRYENSGALENVGSIRIRVR